MRHISARADLARPVPSTIPSPHSVKGLESVRPGHVLVIDCRDETPVALDRYIRALVRRGAREGRADKPAVAQQGAFAPPPARLMIRKEKPGREPGLAYKRTLVCDSGVSSARFPCGTD